MSENAKTIAFVAVGMVAIMIGLLARPSTAELDEETLVDTVLTKSFKNVDDAKSLRIVRFDDASGARREFDVAEQDNGLWTIPSKDGYPADAAEQMAAAATSLIDRKILQVASRSGQDHEQYGVIDPMSAKLEPGQEGVGTRVTMLNDKKEPLVDLIVGKAVKDREGQRYVREAGRDAVYVIEVDRSKLSTNFEDWIEKDLLKLQTWDLQQVDVKDYSAALVLSPDGSGLSVERDDRAEFVFGYDDGKGKWTPEKLASFDRGQGKAGEYVEFKLAEDEELNEEKLNGLKTALGDLKIVDVVRKPAGLSQDLKAGAEFVKNEEAFVDLLKKGFTATGGGEGAPTDIISSDGEVIATLKNGTEYVLRFGNVTNVARGEKDDAATPTDAADAAKKSGDDVHRYMFVMARQNKDAVKQPDLKPLPELPAKEEAKPAETPAPPDASAPPPAEAATATPPADEAAPADAAKADEAKSEATPPAETSPTDAAEAKKADEAKNDEAPADKTPVEQDKDKELEKIMAERKRIEDENQRKTTEYQDLLKKGEEQVKELNLRFGDWYFVVDDDVFKKLRLGRSDVIKKKEPPKAEDAATPGAANSSPPADATPAGLPAIPGAAQ